MPFIFSSRYQNQCCVNNIGSCFFPHSSWFPSFEVLSSKDPSWLSCFGGPKGLPFGLSFSKVSRLHFSNPSFGCFPFYHFSQVSWFLPTRLKDPQPPSFMVLLPGFTEVPSPYSWVVGSQVFWSLFCVIGWLIRTYMFLFFVFLGMPPWHFLITSWLCYIFRGS